MRPIFSPTDFVQIKGRGTRKFNFSKCIVGDKEMKANYAASEKEHFKLFDFFANCEYFEEKFNYDEVLKLPKPSEFTSSPIGQPHPTLDGYEHTGTDVVSLMTETKIGAEGMRIDRMFFKKFEENIKDDEFIKDAVEAENWQEAESYVRKEKFDKPNDYINLDKIKRSLSIDRRISVREVLEYIFGMIPKIKMKNELLEDEFERFIDDNKSRFEEDVDIAAMRYYFKAYICDPKVRDVIDNKQYGELNVLSSFTMADFKAVTNGWKQWIPDYIKNYVPLNRFM